MSLIDRAKNMLFTPKTEWEVIAGEEPQPNMILTGYIIPLAALPAISSLIGSLVISSMFTSIVGFGGFSLGYSIGMAVVAYIVGVAGVYLTALIVDLLATSFGSEKNFGRALQLVAYSYTASWVGGLFNFIPILGWLISLAGSVWSIVTMYWGFPHTMNTPQDKVVVYMIVTVVILIVIYFALTAILAAIVAAIFGFGAMGLMSM